MLCGIFLPPFASYQFCWWCHFRRECAGHIWNDNISSNYRCGFFNYWRNSHILVRVNTKKHRSKPWLLPQHQVSRRRLERITLRFTPEINMPPCHACPCITEPQPDISCSMRELVDEAGVAGNCSVFTGIRSVRRTEWWPPSHTWCSHRHRGASERHPGDKHVTHRSQWGRKAVWELLLK